MKYQAGRIVDTTNKGRVLCNKNILLSIVNLAAKEIAGVSKLNKTFASFVSKLFSNNFYEGVRVDYSKEGIVIDIYLSVYYGESVAEVVYRVQENVKNGILAMIDIKINSINVHVMGVDFKTEE